MITNINRSVLLKADGLLLKHYISRLPITLEELERIAKEKSWILDTYQETSEFLHKANLAEFVKKHKAFTTIFDGYTMILYDGQLPYAEKLQCICHEMGHVVLRHTTERGIVGLCAEPERMLAQEAEADAFAAEMMAPACVMFERGVKDIQSLIDTNLISDDQAVKHIRNITHSADSDEERRLCDRLNGPAKLPEKKGKSPSLTRKYKIMVAAFLAIAAVAIAFPFNVYPKRENTSVTSVSTVSTVTEAEDGENTVYVTVSGEKYHKKGCYHIKNKDNLVELSIEDAEAAGYEPCKDCF